MRAKELSTRLSIGATRGRLMGQLMTESLVLGVITAAVSVVIAEWTLALFRGLLPDPDLLPDVATVIPFVAGTIAIAANLALGALPALLASRTHLLAAHRRQAGARAGDRRSARVRITLTAAQVAFSMALVVLAGLFTKSLANALDTDPGLRTEGVVAFVLSPASNGYTAPRSAALFDRVETELAAVPGVSGVTSGTTRILNGQERTTQVFVDGFDAAADADRDSRFDEVGGGYFRTLGIPLIAGREFTEADAGNAANVAIVNERFARKFGLGAAAVGRRMSARTPALDMEIVGVVRDFKQSRLTDDVAPMYFVPYRQEARYHVRVFYVRSSPAAVGATTAGIRDVVRRIDPNLPVEELRTLDDSIRGSSTGQRVMSVMTLAFAALALFVAAIGLYGILAYTVAQRTPEIGIRMALGATRPEMRALVLRQVTTIVIGGGAIGLTAAILVGRLAQGLLFGLQFHDTGVIASAIAVLVAVAFAAAAAPAHRAASIDPVRALCCDS
jgi:predicted permease